MASEHSVRVFELFENTVFENTLCSRTGRSRTCVRVFGSTVSQNKLCSKCSSVRACSSAVCVRSLRSSVFESTVSQNICVFGPFENTVFENACSDVFEGLCVREPLRSGGGLGEALGTHFSKSL